MKGYGSRVVATITGLSHRQYGYWDKTPFIKPSLAMSSGKGTRRLYDFVDLVQFRVAVSLKEKGISLQKMRKCLTFLRKRKEELERPLASLKFLTDGDIIFVLTTNRQVVMDTLKEGQLVFSLAIGEMLKELSGKIQEVETDRKFPVRIGKERYTAVLHGDAEEGGDWGECPERPGCVSPGETVEEGLEMMRDAIRGHLAAARREGTRRN